MSRSRTKFDELNILGAAVMAAVAELVQAIEEEAENYDSIDFLLDLLASTVIPTVEEYLEMEYDGAFQTGIDGWMNVAPDSPTRLAAIYAEVDGKTFADRIEEYAAEGLDGFETKLAALVATDGHRVRSEGTLAAGDKLQSVGLTVTKTWKTLKDDKVRDAHDKLHDVTIPYDDLFDIDGYKAPAPGLFGVAELDCNCRCELEIHVVP